MWWGVWWANRSVFFGGGTYYGGILLDQGVPFQEYVSKMCKWVKNLSNTFSVSVSSICEIRTFHYWVGRTHTTYCWNVPYRPLWPRYGLPQAPTHYTPKTPTYAPKHPFTPQIPFACSSYSHILEMGLPGQKRDVSGRKGVFWVCNGEVTHCNGGVKFLFGSTNT